MRSAGFRCALGARVSKKIPVNRGGAGGTGGTGVTGVTGVARVIRVTGVTGGTRILVFPALPVLPVFPVFPVFPLGRPAPAVGRPKNTENAMDARHTRKRSPQFAWRK